MRSNRETTLTRRTRTVVSETVLLAQVSWEVRARIVPKLIFILVVVAAIVAFLYVAPDDPVPAYLR